MGDRWDEFRTDWRDESPHLKTYMAVVVALVVGAIAATLITAILSR